MGAAYCASASVGLAVLSGAAGYLSGVLVAGRVRTRDLGGRASTTEFTDAVCREIEK